MVPVDAGDRHTRLKACVAKLERAQVRGEVEYSAIERDALARICAEHGLLVEAGRVRRWTVG